MATDKKIMMLMGPNLNMLGTREPDIYGSDTLEDVERACADIAAKHGYMLILKQSDHEGELVGWIQECLLQDFDGLIINGAAYGHTSIAIHDALKLLSVPIIETHFSDPKIRESFRHTSFIEPLAQKIFAGEGLLSHTKAVKHLISLL